MRALIVVEPDFLDKHVGVKRVIFYHLAELERLGYEVELGTPAAGQVWLLRRALDDRETPVESASGAAREEGGALRPGVKPVLVKTDQRARPGDYATIVIANPWLCALGLPALPGCVGLAYDLVPNLVAAGCLRFSDAPGIYRFARDHDMGYRYYLEHARRILCISESTRRDLIALYRPAREDLEIATHIPFDCKPGPAGEPLPNTVLLVNVLDMRKNLDHVADVLERAHGVAPFRLIVVAKERVPAARVLGFFSRMDGAGIPYTWYRDIDDECLTEQYRKSTVLLFPSYYEGLGLPILEAQQEGVPAVSTNLSSCPEINMNADLCFAPDDVQGMAEALVGILSGSRQHLKGERLRQALFDHLQVRRDVATGPGVAAQAAA